MKTFKLLFIQFIAFFVLLAGSASAQSRSEKEMRIKRLLDSKNFTFVARSANPMSGGNIQLNSSNYQLSFYNDSLESYLPYFGVAYRAQYGSAESPLIFSSGHFSYQAKASKRGGQTLTIKLNSPNDPDVMILSVSPSGYGTLQVSSVNRQPISFYGSITSNRKNAN